MRVAACLAAAALAIAPAARACDADVPAVRSVAEGIVDADNERDIDRVLGYYADDAVLMPPGEPPVGERALIRGRYESLFASFDPRIEARVDEVCAHGDLAIVRGHNGGRLVSRAGGASRELDDAWLMVLRRVDGGDWKISRLMWHPQR